jgi:hypothetical protein
MEIDFCCHPNSSGQESNLRNSAGKYLDLGGCSVSPLRDKDTHQAFHAWVSSFHLSGTQHRRASAESQNLGFNLVCALRLRLETIRDELFVG